MTRLDYVHALERRGLLWRTWPYLAMMGLAWLLLPWVGVIDHPRIVVAAAILNVVLVATVIALPWDRLGPAEIAPPLMWLGVVALLRHGTDGANAGYSPLVLLAIIWCAVYGSRWMLAVSIVAVFVMLALPTVVGAEELYPDTEVRRAILYCVFGALVGTAIQEMIGNLRAERQRRMLAEAELTRRRAFELNDDVVQDLAVAKLAFEADRPAEGRAAVERALAAGKRIISDMVQATGSFERRQPPQQDD